VRAQQAKGATEVSLDGAVCSFRCMRASASGVALALSSSSLSHAHPVVVVPCGDWLLVAQEKWREEK
jgi:hypothetical protein